LAQDDATVMDIVDLLNTDKDSPLKWRVKTCRGRKTFGSRTHS